MKHYTNTYTLLVKGLMAIVTFSSYFSFTQLGVNNTLYTKTQLVNSVLLASGDGTTISNVQFTGVDNVSSRYQVGYFTTATTTQVQMGFSSGILLTSGNTSEMPLTLGTNPRSTQISRNYVSCTSGEVRKTGTCGQTINDLNILSGGYDYYNVATLEFDFVPVGGAVAFRYIFGSEEYQDNSGLINYQCSDYNDRFGFLISGPGIAGGQGYSNNARNIARLSNGAAVSINAVNNGIVGSSGGLPNATKCTAANSNWSNGNPSAEYLGTIDGTQMNGNTRILTAYQGGLTPGATYHIKLIVMDIEDGAYDSVVYLEGGSFTTDPILLPVDLSHFSGTCFSQGVSLAWSAERERNNAYYELERFSSTSNEIAWSVALPSNSSTYYEYADYSAPFGTNYYRLSQTDYDGKKTLLKVIAVENDCGKTENPIHAIHFKDNEFHIFYSSLLPIKTRYRIISTKGEIILSDNLKLDNNEKSLSIPIPNNRLVSGIYFHYQTDKF